MLKYKLLLTGPYTARKERCRMTAWLVYVQKMLDNLPAQYHNIVSKPIQEGERSIGGVPQSLRGIWGLCRMLEEKRDKLKKTHHETNHHHNKQDCAQFIDEYRLVKENLRAIRSLFYTSLKYEVFTPNGVIDVRGDYDVVTWEKAPRSTDVGCDENEDLVSMAQVP